MNGVRVGRYLQTYSKTDFAPRLGFAYDLGGTGRTILRGGFGMFWNTPLTGTASSKGQNPPFLLSQFKTSCSSCRGSTTPRERAADTDDRWGLAIQFRPGFRDGYAQQWSVNVQRQLGTNYMFEVGYVGSRGRQLVALVDVNQAPAQLGVTNSNVNRPFFRVNPALGSVAQSQSRGTLDYHALQARFVRRFSGASSPVLHVRQGDRPARIPTGLDVPELLRPRLQPRARELRRHPRVHVDLDLHAAVRSQRWFGSWQISGLLLARSGYPFTVFQSQNPLSTMSAASRASLSSRGLDRARSTPTVDRGSIRAHSWPRASPRPRSATPGEIFCADPVSSRSTPRSRN